MKTVRYHLRFILTPERHRAEERALWRAIRQGGIDEVLFFVPHAEERSPGIGTPEDNRRMADLLAPLFRRLRRRGIAPSINMWWTAAFSDFPNLPRDQHARASFRWAVNLGGRESRAVACPRDEAWRTHIAAMYRTYAALEPERIWIDDDVRMTLRADMHCPCMCDECLAELAHRVGRPIARADFLREFLADPPNPVRDAWLAYQHQLMVEICGRLASEVHAVSPRTRVCLMHSPMEMHAAEGRNWGEVVDALGVPRPMLRPSIGPYQEATGPGIAGPLNVFRHALAALPLDHTDVAPEIENYPGHRFVKSAKLVELDLTLAQVLGVPESTLSLFRFGGGLDRELARDTAWLDSLARLKPRLQAIANLSLEPGQARGVGLFFHEAVCRHVRGVQNEPKPIFVYRERPWDQCLPLLGLATQYGPAAVTAFSGEQLDCLSDAELKDVFARGVLLDARAAECLVRRGRGDLAGLHRRLADAPGIQEVITDKAFGSIAGDVMSLRWEGPVFQFECLPGACVVSHVVDYDGRVRGHGVVCFENALGGRVVVYPYDGQLHGVWSLGAQGAPLASPSFLNWPRQAQLRAAAEWAGRAPAPLFVPGAPSVYPILMDQGSRLVVAVANLLPDPVSALTLRLGRPRFRPRRVRALTAEGRWQTVRRVTVSGAARGVVTVDTGLHLGYLDVAVLSME